MPDIQIFHAPNSCSLASVIALEEAGLPYDLESIDLNSDRAAYREIVGSGRVPALRIDGELLVESPAILMRIASLAPTGALMPEEHREQMQMLSFLCWCASSVHIARRRLRRPHHFTSDFAAQASISRDARPAVEANLLLLDGRVRDRQWMVGPDFTVADPYALVFYGWALLDEMDARALPNLRRWAERMTERPRVRAALLADNSPVLPSER